MLLHFKFANKILLVLLLLLLLERIHTHYWKGYTHTTGKDTKDTHSTGKDTKDTHSTGKDTHMYCSTGMDTHTVLRLSYRG